MTTRQSLVGPSSGGGAWTTWVTLVFSSSLTQSVSAADSWDKPSQGLDFHEIPKHFRIAPARIFRQGVALLPLSSQLRTLRRASPYVRLTAQEPFRAKP